METVHLTYRCAVTGRILRMETYTPVARYGFRAYIIDAILWVALSLTLASATLAYILLTGN